MPHDLNLNKQNKNILLLLRSTVFIVFLLGSTYFSYQLLFPSAYFTQSFKNMESIKNTITDVSVDGKTLSFYASTPQDFSEIAISLELEKKSPSLEGVEINVNKSFKAFFYPQSATTQSTADVKENLLVASADAIFIITDKQKNPFDNPQTFEGLGYKWENIESQEIDLGEYEKDNLLNISSAHPDGTILSTDKENYFRVQSGEKQLLSLHSTPQLLNFKNNILVQEESLNIKDNCKLEDTNLLENKLAFKNRFACNVVLEKIINFSGKDYRFEINNLPDSVKLKEINIEFKKAPTKKNLFLFLADIKTKVTARFLGEKL